MDLEILRKLSIRSVCSLNRSSLFREFLMENKAPSQNIQDVYLNTVRRDKAPVTVFLISGVKLIGKIKGFDKYSVILEANNQEQLIFKHAISTVTTVRT